MSQSLKDQMPIQQIMFMNWIFLVYDQQGTYYIEAEDGAKSREFQIGNGEMYSYMLYDSLNYFYQNRSGIDIESQYIISGDSSSLARAAGHPSDVATIEQTWGYSGSSGTQDVTGGWYDAGDHGNSCKWWYFTMDNAKSIMRWL